MAKAQEEGVKRREALERAEANLKMQMDPVYQRIVREEYQLASIRVRERYAALKEK